MKRIISISEVVESARSWQGQWELRATAEADYHETKSELVVQLDSFVRTADVKLPSGLPQGWLPKKQTLVERMPWEDALPAAKEIFQRWVRKVRQSLPSTVNH